MNTASGAQSAPALAALDHATERHAHDVSLTGLARHAGSVGVPLDATAVARFAIFRDLLHWRGGQFNLTAIHSPEEIERRLMLDAIAMVPTLDALTRERNTSTDSAIRLIDIGSGAGFPGLALKITRPELDVTLVDATAKKVAFLSEAITNLDLAGIVAVHRRAEEIGHDPAYRACFDVATARAVAVLPVLLEYVVPLLKVGGVALLPKGLAIDDELKSGRRAAASLGVTVLSADRLATGATRLVVARKSAATPDDYPRRTGVPSREPLGERR